MEKFRSAVVCAAVAAAMGWSTVGFAEGGAPAAHAMGQGHKPHWTYSGAEGPVNWGAMSEEFKTCATGKSQSPIDISAANVTTLSNIEVSYKPSPLTVVNNGHTIQVNYAPGSSINVGGKQFDLLQFHFHSPSENTVGGKAYDMEAHLVHKAADGQLGVIGVLMKAGSENAVIKTIWSNMPKEAGTVEKADVSVNAADLLPKDLSYFNFSGSLTTPPCSEGVNWMVLTAPTQMSTEQVSAFTTIFPLSARPVQPVNGRVVTLSN